MRERTIYTSGRDGLSTSSGAAHTRQYKEATPRKGRVDEGLCRRDLPITRAKTSARLVGTPFRYASRCVGFEPFRCPPIRVVGRSRRQIPSSVRFIHHSRSNRTGPDAQERIPTVIAHGSFSVTPGESINGNGCFLRPSSASNRFRDCSTLVFND